MGKQVWQSKDGQIISKYAERLEPADAEEEDENEDLAADSAPKSQAQGSTRQEMEGLDFRYMNGLPPKDLLNYKNMDLEMSLWAKTPTGWLSVAVLVVMAFICFILTWILWIVHG
jgi:hypothetical protein